MRTAFFIEYKVSESHINYPRPFGHSFWIQKGNYFSGALNSPPRNKVTTTDAK